MATIIIRCPKSGQSISTGIETDADSFDRPACGLDHTWWKREAWISDLFEQELPQRDSGALPPDQVKG